jgi:hypothetical protein
MSSTKKSKKLSIHFAQLANNILGRKIENGKPSENCITKNPYLPVHAGYTSGRFGLLVGRQKPSAPQV